MQPRYSLRTRPAHQDRGNRRTRSSHVTQILLIHQSGFLVFCVQRQDNSCSCYGPLIVFSSVIKVGFDPVHNGRLSYCDLKYQRYEMLDYFTYVTDGSKNKRFIELK